jgi:dTDP-4-amino-4,6-dideoxygalactose transaminase
METMPDRSPTAPRLAIPMLDFQREFRLIRDEVMAAIEAVCDSQRFILGPEVARFEAAAAHALGVPRAIGCASGTDALWLALAALKIGACDGGPDDQPHARPDDRPQDAVLTTPFSFFATVSSILRAGAAPVLADIDPRTFNLSPESVREAIAANSRRAHPRRLAAILPVHLYGQCADMTAFHSIAAEHDLKIVEDAAQAFGASWHDPAASLNARAGALGDAAAFSFYPTKNLAAFGDAGMVTTRSPEIAERAAMLRAHGMRTRYFHDEVGWNSRLDTLQAAVLEVKLKHLEAGNTRRRQIATLYDQLFRSANLAAPASSHDIADGLVLPFTDPRATPVFHQYVLRAPRRDELRAHLTANNIGSEIYYPLPLHLQKSLAFLGYHPGDFPHAERAAAEVLAIPVFPELRDDEVATVVEAIRRFYS